ncbi:hypothetical protein [Treponema denticola]|uniref:Uncharacterized protein n=1 Tax=Treponema denticola SP33 TaxID=999437 RepID=M2BLM7_TREDN|nr:hypothetical protein [Treponema denticola]EMB22383.1 hypothetical protein HMPREF9733_01799 [Treponema denticola SP33]EPF35339.1 hypothetical protein HMPREF9732_02664 [Treponema denticola SP32]
MKKTVFFVLMILVLMVSSCNLFLKEEYGELILSFDGTLPDGARALGPDGLPILSTTSMKINIIREDGYTVIRELDAEEPKSLVELIPVGEKIEISVTAYNASSQWSGKTVHTVTSGQNHVRVLLNKNVSGLKNLLFTQTKTTDPYGSDSYNLTFYMSGKEINAPQSQLQHNFGRDSKGRLYISVKNGDPYIYRYMSEGVYDTNKQLASDADFLANDYTTGKMYGLSGSAISKIEENLSLTSLPAPLPSVSAPFAVDNGIFTWASIGLSVIHLWKAGIAPPGVHGSFSAQATEYKLGTNDGFAIKDIFIRNGYVYLLLAAVRDKDPRGLYSLGAVLKWKIGTNPASGYPQFEGTPVVLGKSAGSPVIENGVLKNYDYSKSFYGAVKVIGFDEENIYIADDGFDAAYVDDYPRIVKNRNRIAALNITTNALSFSDERTAKWYNEWKEWAGTKTIVWDYSGSSYYQVETGAENPLPAAFATGLTDVFCYDAAGNLYVAKEMPAKEVHRFELKDDGSYGSGVNKSISVMPDAMAVSVSSIAADAGKTILFYYKAPSGSPYTHKIERLAWPTDSFTPSVPPPPAITLADLGQNDTVTALAANKDGIFAAVKTVTNKGSANEKYKLTVKKYAHTPLTGSSTTVSGTVTVVGETSANYDSSDRDKYINENLNALYIKDGILYGLITKQKGAATGMNSDSTEVFIGGKLVKIGEAGASFGSPAVTLYERTGFTPETSGRFAPYRFIAIKPKKLVIASKGYYGKLINNDNPLNPVTDKKTYKKVFVFDIGNWANPAETITQVGFSKDLYYSNGFYWY